MCVIVPNFGKMGQTVAELVRFNVYFKMAAVRHLGFVGHVFGLPAMSTWYSLSLCKIWLESMQ